MYWIDPIGDPRWAQFVEQHPQASVFHTASWLEALRRTYGYQPIAMTSSPPGIELNNGIAFCGLKSWISGSRLVSLPFSDHCQPLLKCAEDLSEFTTFLREHCGQSGWEYAEIRPLERIDQGSVRAPSESNGQGDENIPLELSACASDFAKFEEYNFHRIDLRPNLETLFSNFHKSCVQRKIHRAERESLEYEAGRSESHLTKFYRLLLLTRRRHGLPPQPMTWFRNLKDCAGESLTIRIASKSGQPIASILTLRYKGTVVYKYGCSDAAFHRLGGMPMLFWKAIKEGKQQGAVELDLGRSNLDNPGLNTFKHHLGAVCSRLTYFRLSRHRSDVVAGPRLRIVNALFARMPGRLARIAGRVVYRHMG
jgi:hypothetical protein